MSLGYVNFMGEPVALDATKHAKPKAAKEQVSTHMGWRVVGVPPGALEKARAAHMDTRKPFDDAVWLRKFKKQAVRTKPYEIPQAAQDCIALAEKAGWTHLESLEIKKEFAPQSSLMRS